VKSLRPGAISLSRLLEVADPRNLEQMAGFDLIDCADLDEAIEVVSKHPVARLGTIELRPLTEDCR
jgi:hypothetical protein